MTEQRIINQQLRLALRTGVVPYTFEALNDKEGRTRKIVCEMQIELKKKFSCHKNGKLWIINLA